MARPALRTAVVFTTFAALVALVLRSLRSAPLPSSSMPSGGSAPSTTMAPATVAEPLPGIDGPDPLVADNEPTANVTSGDVPDWVAAVDGEPAPATHPVKAKMSSRIYHVPGGLSYDRTKADRWYRSAEAAEADGLRAAKR